jgi:hypothetical protein
MPRSAFVHRLLRHALFVAAVIGASLVLGMMGYVFFAGMSWVDAFLNAAMLLGGMGPVGELTTTPAKIFAGLYALYSGLVLLAAAGILVAPIAHRVLHKLHIDDRDLARQPQKSPRKKSS